MKMATQQCEIGNQVKLFAVGGNANIEFNGCWGIVTDVNSHSIKVDIDKQSHPTPGSNIRFNIGENDFGYKIICGDWDT